MTWWNDWGPAVAVEGGLVASGLVRGTRNAGDAKGVGAEIVHRMVGQANEGLVSRGRAYARSGQTISMTIEPGRIHALVQGSGTAPYSVTFACDIPPDHRRRLIEAFEHALKDPTQGIPARGTPALRDEIDACELLTDVPITAGCTCPYGAVCKHCIALAYVVADRLDGSPIAVASFFGVRDEDLGTPSPRLDAPEAPDAVTTFDARRHAQLARTIATLLDKPGPDPTSIFAAAAKVLAPPAAVRERLGIDPEPESSD
jgi:uncharacterized Zn finger protein